MNSPAEVVPTTEDLRKSYDEIPYRNLAKPFTHITRVAAVGRLRGVLPASPEDCRVLELGCADGGNLVPMALQFPASRFVGIDLSGVQIESGREKAADLSVSNLELRTADILELDPGDLECYDYIIVHGVYSWVPSAVRDKILSICRDHLNENGLAYISYNTYPGWRGKQALREMLRYHTRRIGDARKRVAAAAAFLKTIPTPAESPGDPAAILVERLRTDLANVDDPVTYLVHEYLVDANRPMYFNEFLGDVEAVGLQYVDDAFPGSTSLDRLSPAARKWVEETFSDYAQRQQYVDFICNISFRRSLLCRAGLPLDYGAAFDRMRPLYATATCSREDPVDGVARFRTDPGRSFSVDHPDLLAVLESLADARPASVGVSKLREIMGNDVSDDGAAGALDGLLRNAAVEFTSHPFGCTRDPGERPYASELVRYQAADGLATSGAHRPVRLEDSLEEHLLILADGTRTAPELVSLLRRRLTPDKPIDDDRWLTLVQDRLSRLADAGLFANARSEPVC